MLNLETHFRGTTLPVVMVISILVLLMVLFVYSLWNMNFLYYSSYHYRKQQQENLHSAIVLYSNDSTFLREYDEEKVFTLFKTDTTSTVRFITRRWGLYESIHVSSRNGKFSSTCLLGKKQECDYQAALWLCDRNRTLSLSGETEIQGKIFAPLSGINYPEIDDEHYNGERISQAFLDIAGAQLPPIDSANLIFPVSLKGKHGLSVDLPTSTQPYYSFHHPTNYFKMPLENENLDGVSIRGNVVLFADELTIPASSRINEAIIVARKVTIEEGFTGSIQIFCTDTVLIRENVRLQYPSGIYLEARIEYPYVLLSGNSEVNGYMIILGKTRDEELLFPSYRQSKKSILRGLLYVDGTTNIQGEISGAVYLKDCFFTSNQNVYAGALFNTRISRNDNIAYPIFLLGKYIRKEVKSIY